MVNQRRGGMGDGTRWAGLAAIVAGVILLGLCASQWDQATGSTMSQAMSAYNGGDRGGLASLGAGALRQSSQTGVEGLAGLFWLGIGIFLFRRAGPGGSQAPYDRREPPRRR